MIARLLLASLIIGIIAGIFIVIYGTLTEFLSHVLYFGDPFEAIPNLPVWYVYLVPIISILIVNYLISKDLTA